jgi:CheY-like chemotaxis protein
MRFHPTPLRVLLVEDEALVSMMIEYALVDHGFKVHAVSNAAQALKFLAGGSPVDVPFTDINLAGEMPGEQLAWHARELRPDLSVVYASGRTRRIDGPVPGSVRSQAVFAFASLRDIGGHRQGWRSADAKKGGLALRPSGACQSSSLPVARNCSSQ